MSAPSCSCNYAHGSSLSTQPTTAVVMDALESCQALQVVNGCLDGPRDKTTVVVCRTGDHNLLQYQSKQSETPDTIESEEEAGCSRHGPLLLKHPSSKRPSDVPLRIAWHAASRTHDQEHADDQSDRGTSPASSADASGSFYHDGEDGNEVRSAIDDCRSARDTRSRDYENDETRPSANDVRTEECTKIPIETNEANRPKRKKVASTFASRKRRASSPNKVSFERAHDPTTTFSGDPDVICETKTELSPNCQESNKSTKIDVKVGAHHKKRHDLPNILYQSCVSDVSDLISEASPNCSRFLPGVFPISGDQVHESPIRPYTGIQLALSGNDQVLRRQHVSWSRRSLARRAQQGSHGTDHSLLRQEGVSDAARGLNDKGRNEPSPKPTTMLESRFSPQPTWRPPRFELLDPACLLSNLRDRTIWTFWDCYAPVGSRDQDLVVMSNDGMAFPCAAWNPSLFSPVLKEAIRKPPLHIKTILARPTRENAKIMGYVPVPCIVLDEDWQATNFLLSFLHPIPSLWLPNRCISEKVLTVGSRYQVSRAIDTARTRLHELSHYLASPNVDSE